MRAMHTYIDAAVLKPELSPEEARCAIAQCVAYAARTVCVRPCDIELAQAVSAGSATAVSCVLAFPHGVSLPKSKRAEAEVYTRLGVAEIDMVVNYGLIRGGEWRLLKEDIEAVTAVAHPQGVLVKAIIESCYLDAEQIRRATETAVEARAGFVKTSTGFAAGGAGVDAVRAMLEAARGRIEVKASGGIRDAAQARGFIEMGVTRLGIGYASLAAICGGEGVAVDAY